ncbi:uncharacterized protein LOC123539212 [Mercenaria mercenaria]|uniref:uncharacterized protein LOC123539212 n=1 Tax=Mercenaria mercenaria TaxID=6596 RepID=UPI00234F9ECC|nr:uncharacterized protein LOC123539212 [Mercenaria mercenaria]
MTSVEQPLTTREVASGASNTADEYTDRININTTTSANDIHDADASNDDTGRGESRQENSRQNDRDPNKGGTQVNSARERESASKQTNRDEATPASQRAVRAPPEGRDKTPLPEITTNREEDKKSPLDGPEASDEDDGGWGTKRTNQSQSKPVKAPGKAPASRRPQRAILQGTSRTTTNVKALPQPMSNNLVIRNGRVPAAWQQTTLFKNVRQSKISPRPGGGAQRSGRLPALSGKKPPGSPAKPLVQTTFRVEEMITKRPNANTKKTKPKLAKSETNYIRLAKIVARVGSDLLRLAFYNYLERQQPPKKLHQFLAANRRRLKSFAGNYKLITRRWDIMYPDDDETKANLEQLDSALIFWFLRFICHLKRPNDFIWKRKPLSDDLSETADIARIRDYRNFLINLSSPALYDDEYERKMKEFKELTLRICGERQGEEMLKIIDDMKTTVVRYSEREQYLDVLNQWADETGDRQIAPAKQSGETIKERKEMTTRFLKTHRNPKVFVRTKIFQKAQEKLMKKGFVILKGNIGDGKTTTAIGLMVANFDEDECLLITNPDQWQYIEPRTVSALLLDDIFGSGSLDEKLLSKWESKFEQIYGSCMDTNESTGVRVIITIRQNILDQCYSKLKQYKLFAKDNFVDCGSDELPITERRLILGRHLLAEDQMVAKSEVDKAAKVHNSKLGFPQCCALFVKKESFLIIGSQFFERPIELLFEQLDRMYDGDKYGYLALVVLMFQKDGILFVKQLEEFTEGAFKTKVLDLAFLCRVPVSDHLNKFTLNALENQVRPYVNFYKDRKCYTFSHESITEAVMASFGERHPQEVLEAQ